MPSHVASGTLVMLIADCTILNVPETEEMVELFGLITRIRAVVVGTDVKLKVYEPFTAAVLPIVVNGVAPI